MDRESRLSTLLGTPERGRWFVLVLSGLAIVLACFLTAQQLAFERRQATEALVRDNQARAYSFEQYVLRTLEAADLATQQLERDIHRNGTGLGRADGSGTSLDRSPLFEGVIIHVPGQTLVSPAGLRLSDVDKEVLDGVRVTGDHSLSVTPPLTFSDGRNLIAVVRALDGDSRRKVAVLLDPKRFTDFATDVSFQDDDLISLIGLDGITRARRTGNMLSSGEDVRGTLVMKRQLANPNGTYLGPSVLDGVPRYFSHRRLARYSLFATSGMSTELVDKQLAPRRFVLLGILAAAICAIIATGAAVLVAAQRRRDRVSEVLAANIRLNEAQKIGSMGDWDYFPAEDRLKWSDNLRAMYGRRDDEEVSQLSDVSQYFSPGDADRIAAEIDAVLQGETRTYDIEVRMPDGRTSMRRIVAAPVRDASGQIIGAHGTDQDITKDAQLREAEARLQELARLESMNALTATLAHELNQPLAIASNYLSAAARHARQIEHPGKVTEMIAEGHKQILHLAQIISAARDLVAHSSSHLVEMPVKDIFDAVVPLLRSLWKGRRAQIDVTVAPGEELVFCNSAQIKQVLFNLGKNGLEALPEDEEPKLSFGVERGEAGGTRFSVTDNGPGISVGDPFAAMSSSKQGGLGLGLALARTIVEAHGGRIWIEKTGPEGTVVAFEIPPQTEEGLVPSQAVH
ncbi:sensor histidine kinase [Sphingomonas edaphi]|uniref:histidine kinase n=1 Tax=Sphingomonas edaphi TaxID=2315689 RepID=A0A418PYC3_9SPHN|nr:ATP-binding protein [Sphingomonas edaphi]RIX27043.1 hypothetical protein D3M59_10835 [Sphingomonas edaphi]